MMEEMRMMEEIPKAKTQSQITASKSTKARLTNPRVQSCTRSFPAIRPLVVPLTPVLENRVNGPKFINLRQINFKIPS